MKKQDAIITYSTYHTIEQMLLDNISVLAEHGIMYIHTYNKLTGGIDAKLVHILDYKTHQSPAQGDIYWIQNGSVLKAEMDCGITYSIIGIARLTCTQESLEKTKLTEEQEKWIEEQILNKRPKTNGNNNILNERHKETIVHNKIEKVSQS